MAINNATAYANAHARVRILYSLLLSPQTWTNLREATDFNALTGLLKDTIYGEYLSKVEDRELDPRRATYQIKGRLVDAYLAVIHAAPKAAQPLLIQLYRHFELDNLKAILRGLVTGSTWEQISYVLFPISQYTELPAQSMAEAGNVAAAVEQLSHTPYYYVLSHAMQRYTNEQSLFPLEVALDLDYWKTLWEYIFELPKSEKARALEILGPLVDTTNLMWGVRYRTYHHLAEEEIINYTLSFGYHLRDENVRAIAAGADIANVVEAVFPGLENVNGLLQQPERGLSLLEMRLQRFLADQYRAVFTGYPFHIGLLLACLLLIELEVHDLTVLIEAKAAQLPEEEFEPYLATGPVSLNTSQPIGGA